MNIKEVFYEYDANGKLILEKQSGYDNKTKLWNYNDKGKLIYEKIQMGFVMKKFGVNMMIMGI